MSADYWQAPKAASIVTVADCGEIDEVAMVEDIEVIKEGMEAEAEADTGEEREAEDVEEGVAVLCVPLNHSMSLALKKP